MIAPRSRLSSVGKSIVIPYLTPKAYVPSSHTGSRLQTLFVRFRPNSVRLSCKPHTRAEGFASFLTCVSTRILWECLLLQIDLEASIGLLFNLAGTRQKS
jgi:hypothetical protein